MLFSATPDLPRLTEICRRELANTALVTKNRQPAPTADAIAGVLTDYLTNLREALLDQEAYHELIESDMRRILKEMLGIVRQKYDGEATYRSQMAAMYRELDFVGIPELKERRPITIDDIFIRLRAEADNADEGRAPAAGILRAGRAPGATWKSSNACGPRGTASFTPQCPRNRP